MSQSYASHSDFSDGSFWEKVKQCAKSMGRDLLCKALCLYYALQNPAMPISLKLSVMASLAYLVCPVDAIPDFIPVLGYTDDAGVLAAVTATVAAYIDGEVKDRARRTADEWLG